MAYLVTLIGLFSTQQTGDLQRRILGLYTSSLSFVRDYDLGLIKLPLNKENAFAHQRQISGERVDELLREWSALNKSIQKAAPDQREQLIEKSLHKAVQFRHARHLYYNRVETFNDFHDAEELLKRYQERRKAEQKK
jgi:hypothetical protein